MLSQFLNRQGFNKSITGVEGTTIQSCFTKPLIEDRLSFANLSWLPYPYGPLPDVGPWIDKEDNWSRENPTPETPTPGAQGHIPESTTGNAFMLLTVAGLAFFLVYGKGVFK